MISLKARISLSATAVLVVFVALTAFTLDRAFRANATENMRERLLAQIYLVMAAAEVDEQGRLSMPPQLAEPRLALPGSGLYARIHADNGEALWQSDSSIGQMIPDVQNHAGELFTRLALSDSQYFLASLKVQWLAGDRSVPLRFSVTEDTAPFETRLAEYRHGLWGWLGALAILLVITLIATLAWGLRPLRRAESELKAIEAGAQESLNALYPEELHRLTDNINTLMRHERARQSRYQHALADLAHSLKTPLAVLRAQADAASQPGIEEQVTRMDAIIQYQLQRAATAGRSALAVPIQVGPILKRLAATLDKVYRDKGITLRQTISATASFRGDEGDLLELLGNLLDNAYKYANGRVHTSMDCEHGQLRIVVEDDGPGITKEQVQLVLTRGVRLDESAPGHGIGLAMVRDIVSAYDGHLGIEHSSALGGAALIVRLPGC